MNSFAYAAPKTVPEAVALLGNEWGRTEVMAGGTDLVTCLKQAITSPERVVSLKHIKELKGIRSKSGQLMVGSTTTLAELIENADVKKHFPALVTAAQGVGSAQLLHAGTVGGDLCQRPRCWYFRNGFGLLARDGDTSLAREGDNRYHAVFGNDGPALFVSPSSLGPALVALGAEMTIAGAGGKTRRVAAAEFFRAPKSDKERETALQPNEILTEISIPMKGLKNATYEVRHRHGLDWPYATASVAFAWKGGSASDAQVVLGHVAPLPWRSPGAGASLNNAAVNEGVAVRCGEAAAQGATPLSGNAYKVQMVKVAVKRAVLAAAS
ncbi:MAG TPA: FAD binding domain-containing protein [Candidatus Saccharimonadales bacterium]|jgi:xanthine dehydrogenase YagS FAD-binding subunit|nr:FAD binding domain-containing protein [Candidatus Saccharimonadales bacterium]